MNTLQGDSLNRLLKIFAEHDFQDCIYWNSDLEFFVNCSDLFAWGCADLEPIENDSDIDLLAECLQECPSDGLELFCARKRKMRPQGAMYKYFDEIVWPLFDSCGPYREACLGNPVASGSKD